MRKFLLGLLCVILAIALGFIAIHGFESIEIIKTYEDVQEAFDDYQSALDTLENKNTKELPKVEAMLNPEYSPSDSTNVIKKYNDSKKQYDDLLARQKQNASIGSADIYDIEYIWATVGKYAKDYSITCSIDVTESEKDLKSKDYIMCNLDFEVSGRYNNVASFIDSIELDSSIAFQINDFFMEGFSKTARNQSKDTDINTEYFSDNGETTVGYNLAGSGSSSQQDTQHALDVIADFTIYNVPLNRRNLTNVKTATGDSTVLEGEESADAALTSEAVN